MLQKKQHERQLNKYVDPFRALQPDDNDETDKLNTISFIEYPVLRAVRLPVAAALLQHLLTQPKA